MTLSTPESDDLSACTPVWSQGNKIQLHLLASVYVQLGETVFPPTEICDLQFFPYSE